MHPGAPAGGLHGFERGSLRFIFLAFGEGNDLSRLVQLGHGDGGALTRELISRIFEPHLGNPLLGRQEDAALFSLPGGKVALATDSFIVDPLFFPGGDIGKLAVCGTVNDLAVMGARPLYLTAGFIIEEGLPMEELERVAVSMARAAAEAGVEIVAADTKVTERGAADRLFINTTGIGLREEHLRLGAEMVRPGDSVIVSGPVGNHGMVILASRMGISPGNGLLSDCACLWPLIREIIKDLPVRFMRDATRGGLATVLSELAAACRLDIIVKEEEIPLCREVMELSEMLGVDPLYLACEGCFIAVVPPGAAPGVVERLNRFEQGRGAAVIGRLQEGGGRALLRTRFGGTRALDFLRGQHIPRIC